MRMNRQFCGKSTEKNKQIMFVYKIVCRNIDAMDFHCECVYNVYSIFTFSRRCLTLQQIKTKINTHISHENHRLPLNEKSYLFVNYDIFMLSGDSYKQAG